MTQFHFLFGVGEIYWKLSIATWWEYTIIYLLVVGYANAKPLISLNFVLTDDILVKAQYHDLFHDLFLSRNSKTSLMGVGVVMED